MGGQPLFPMNLTSFQDRLQRQPPARLVFAQVSKMECRFGKARWGWRVGQLCERLAELQPLEGSVLPGVPGEQQERMSSLTGQMPAPSAWRQGGTRATSPRPQNAEQLSLHQLCAVCRSLIWNAPWCLGASNTCLKSLLKNRCLTKWISAYAKDPDQIQDQPLTHIHLGSLSFSQII